MNFIERKLLKRANDSKNNWKEKALKRQNEKRMRDDRIRYLEKVVEKQKTIIEKMPIDVSLKKKSTSP